MWVPGTSTIPQARRGHGCLLTLLGSALLCVAVAYGVAAITSPWAFHIGGRWTPLLYWSGSGELHTKAGSYPLYVSLWPGRHGSRLRLDGLHPTGGLTGSGYLCTSPGEIEQLNLSGTIYGGWRTTEGSLMEFRLLERLRTFDNNPRRGYFDLYGRWQGPELVMDDRGRIGGTFRNGMRMDKASVALDWGSYSDFRNSCARMAASSERR